MNGWVMCIMHGKMTRYVHKNAISWTLKFKLNVWYVDHFSPLLDLKILFLTVKKVFVREGISQEGQATMSYFDGTN